MILRAGGVDELEPNANRCEFNTGQRDGTQRMTLSVVQFMEIFDALCYCKYQLHYRFTLQR